jgi:hypothetical protein
VKIVSERRREPRCPSNPFFSELNEWHARKKSESLAILDQRKKKEVK